MELMMSHLTPDPQWLLAAWTALDADREHRLSDNYWHRVGARHWLSFCYHSANSVLGSR